MERRDRLEKQLNESATAAPIAPPPTSPAAAELSRLKQQLTDLRRQFADEYPDVIRLKNQIAALEDQIPAKPPEADAPAAPARDPRGRLRQDMEDVDAELQSLKNEEGSLHQAITAYEQRVENAPKLQEAFQTLSRDSQTTKDRYNTLHQRYEEARLAASLEHGQQVEQFRLLDPALPPRFPAAPNRMLFLTLGFALAVGLAVGAVIAAERLDTAFHSVDELRAFSNVPTLATLPLIVTRRDTTRQRWRMALATASAVIGLGLIVAGSHYVGHGNDQIVRLMARGASRGSA